MFCSKFFGSFLLTFFLIASFTYVNATDGDVLWERAFNNGGNDYIHGIAVDSNNNVIVTGQSWGTGYDYYTIKYDSYGAVLWEKTYNGGGTDIGYAVAVDSNNNVIVTGQSLISSKYNFYTIKYDSNGNALWEKRYSTGSTNRAYGVAVDSSNNVIVTGFRRISSNDNYYTIKYDSNGNVLWEREYDSGGTDEAYGVAVDSNNNVIVTGRANNRYFTRKYDSNGNVIWDKEYYGGWMDYGLDVVVDSSNNVIITGRSLFNNNQYNFYTIKYDSNGNALWERRYSEGSINRAYGVAVDSSNNVIVTGFRRLSGTDSIYTLKYDPDGTIAWDRSYSRALGENDVDLERNGVVVDSYNNVIVAGSVNNGTNWDYYTIKYEGSPAVQTSIEVPSNASVGSTFVVTMNVKNLIGNQISNVAPSALTIGGTGSATFLSGPSPSSTSIAGHSQATFTWTYQAASVGTVNFTGNATADGPISSVSSTSNNVTIQAPASLASSITASPPNVTSGSTITLTMTVSNNGDLTATNVAPSALTIGGTGSATFLSGPSPSSTSIAGHSQATFTWTYQAASVGTVNFTGNATADGPISSVSSTSNNVTITKGLPMDQIARILGISNSKSTGEILDEKCKNNPNAEGCSTS